MATDTALSNGVLDSFLDTLVSLIQDIFQLLQDLVIIEYNNMSMSFFDLFLFLLLLDFFFLFYLLLRK
ncbi:MAG: hypothetical protein IJD66_00815 [Methanocorpusculum sp.]|nr:hypothetical protein [Methanocorpusculum sp.]